MADERTFTQAEVEQMLADKEATVKAEAVKPFEGIDVAKYRQFEKAEADAKRKADEDKGNYETIIKQKDEAHAQETGRLRNELNTFKVKTALEAEASRQNAIDPSQVYLLNSDKLRVNDAGSVEVVGSDGKPLVKDGKVVTPAALVSDFLSANPHFVRAGKGGSGAGGDGSGDGSGKRKLEELDMSKAEDRAYFKEHYA